MGTRFTEEQLLRLASGIGRGIHENKSSVIEAGKLSIEGIDPETKEEAIDILLKRIEMKMDSEQWDLVSGAAYILGVWKVKRAIPVISPLLDYDYYDLYYPINTECKATVRETAAETLKKILGDKKEE